MQEGNEHRMYFEGINECITMVRSQSVIRADDKTGNPGYREQEPVIYRQIKNFSRHESKGA